GVLRRRHVVAERSARDGEPKDAATRGLARVTSETPLQISCLRRTSKATSATSQTPQLPLEITPLHPLARVISLRGLRGIGGGLHHPGADDCRGRLRCAPGLLADPAAEQVVDRLGGAV